MLAFMRGLFVFLVCQGYAKHLKGAGYIESTALFLCAYGNHMRGTDNKTKTESAYLNADYKLQILR